MSEATKDDAVAFRYSAPDMFDCKDNYEKSYFEKSYRYGAQPIGAGHISAAFQTPVPTGSDPVADAITLSRINKRLQTIEQLLEQLIARDGAEADDD